MAGRDSRDDSRATSRGADGDGLLLAVVGDIHGYFEAGQLCAVDYDRVLFVGDLAAFSYRSGLTVAREIASVGEKGLVLLGNHDGVFFRQLVAEAKGQRLVAHALGLGMRRRVAAVHRALGRTPHCGYSRHELRRGAFALTLIAARPHSMGGPRLGYPRYLAEVYGVRSMAESAQRLCRLIDAAQATDLLFLAHNGPTGLGEARDDIFGCDFLPEAGDFGDPDLREAIGYAASRGKRVRAVVAGHMHHSLQGGGARRTSLTRDGTLYLNAARVPRIERTANGHRHHHVSLSVDASQVVAAEHWIETP